MRLVGDPDVPSGAEIMIVVSAVRRRDKWSIIRTYTLGRRPCALVGDPKFPHVAEIWMVVFSVFPHIKLGRNSLI